MSDTNSSTTTEQTATSTEPPATSTEQADLDKPGREAAKYRVQLRETEAQLATAREAVTTAQRGLVDHLARAARVTPDALWAGVTLDKLLDEAGNVSPEAVTLACEDVATRFNLNRVPRPDPSAGRGSEPRRNPLADALRPQ